VGGAVGGAVLAIVLAGCGGTPPIETEPPSTTRAPAFASMDEAFEAAVAVYRRYVELSNQISAEGGIDAERILEVVAPGEFAQDELAFFEGLVRDGIRIEGAMTVRNEQLVQYQDSSRLIQIYACGDVSDTRVINRDGMDVTPERDERVPYLVTMTIAESDAVLIAESELWDSPDICSG
jgi:hypothetical protein